MAGPRLRLFAIIALLIDNVSGHELPSVLTPTAQQQTLMPNAVKLLSDAEPCALFFDLDAFEDGLIQIKTHFMPGTLHAIAMKANPLSACLLLARDHGFGCEVASPCELEHALRLGFQPERIVMDSPAKTRRDLRAALTAGVRLNADNFEELERIDDILRDEFGGGGRLGGGSCRSCIGLRINPQHGEGGIAATGTIAPTSKFGVALMDFHAELIECFRRYAWLECIHCHVGSQGCEQALLVRAVRTVLELADEIDSAVGARQIQSLDIGGGMPVDYASDVADEEAGPERVTAASYAAALRSEVPALFDACSRRSLVTEFGRCISAKCGLMVSRVEYTKCAGGRRIASVHCGADLFLRTAYRPSDWPHRVSAWNGEGRFLQPSTECADPMWDIVGPLCFRGDIVAQEVRLSEQLKSGMVICVHDAGAYTIGMFSKVSSHSLRTLDNVLGRFTCTAQRIPPMSIACIPDGHRLCSLSVWGDRLHHGHSTTLASRHPYMVYVTVVVLWQRSPTAKRWTKRFECGVYPFAQSRSGDHHVLRQLLPQRSPE